MLRQQMSPQPSALQFPAIGCNMEGARTNMRGGNDTTATEMMNGTRALKNKQLQLTIFL
jgi:hypothetical protein